MAGQAQLQSQPNRNCNLPQTDLEEAERETDPFDCISKCLSSSTHFNHHPLRFLRFLILRSISQLSWRLEISARSYPMIQDGDDIRRQSPLASKTLSWRGQVGGPAVLAAVLDGPGSEQPSAGSWSDFGWQQSSFARMTSTGHAVRRRQHMVLKQGLRHWATPPPMSAWF